MCVVCSVLLRVIGDFTVSETAWLKDINFLHMLDMRCSSEPVRRNMMLIMQLKIRGLAASILPPCTILLGLLHEWMESRM